MRSEQSLQIIYADLYKIWNNLGKHPSNHPFMEKQHPNSNSTSCCRSTQALTDTINVTKHISAESTKRWFLNLDNNGGTGRSCNVSQKVVNRKGNPRNMIIYHHTIICPDINRHWIFIERSCFLFFGGWTWDASYKASIWKKHMNHSYTGSPWTISMIS